VEFHGERLSSWKGCVRGVSHFPARPKPRPDVFTIEDTGAAKSPYGPQFAPIYPLLDIMSLTGPKKGL